MGVCKDLSVFGRGIHQLALFQHADSLRFTSAISILLAVVFMLISLGIALYALFKGTATMPRMLPDFSRLSSPFELFTAVPVIVVAFTFHFNGTDFFCTQNVA